MVGRRKKRRINSSHNGLKLYIQNLFLFSMLGGFSRKTLRNVLLKLRFQLLLLLVLLFGLL